MNLTDLLTELRENILHDRSHRVAGNSDILWSDATLIRYIDEAQRRFARKALVIRDGTTDEITLVTLATGVNTYTLHPSVMAVMSARNTADNTDLARSGHSSLDTYRAVDTYFFDPGTMMSVEPGKPLAYTTDERMGEEDFGSLGAVTFRVYPTPSAAYDGTTIRLRVVRMPMDRLTSANMLAVPEIPEQHHLEMLDWAAYLALRIVDVDAGMPDRAKEFATSFEEHVTQARRESMRKLFAPTPWGFGRAGFTWER